MEKSQRLATTRLCIRDCVFHSLTYAQGALFCAYSDHYTRPLSSHAPPSPHPPLAMAEVQVTSALGCFVCSVVPAHRCSRCKRIAYCSAGCQKQDWKRHTTECSLPDAPGTRGDLEDKTPLIQWFEEHPETMKNLYKLQQKNLIAPGHVIVLRKDGKMEFIASTVASFFRVVSNEAMAGSMCTYAKTVQPGRKMFLVEKHDGDWYLGESAIHSAQENKEKTK